MNNSRSKKPGYDYLLQGETGWMSLTGEVDGPPAKSGLSLVDFAAGYVAAMTILAGVHGARKSGVGMDCDLSLYDVALNLLTYPATWFLTAGEIPIRQDRSSHPSIVPFQNFPTATEWIVLGCAKEKFWEKLVIAIERPELKNDERFNSFANRRKNKKDLIEILDEELLKKPANEWISILESNNVPCARIQTLPQALSDPFANERGMVIEVPHPHWGSVKQIRTPVNIGDMSKNDYRNAPELNADAEKILEQLNYSKADLKRFADSGAFGSEI
jgi:crotonobetainyl-CoA:carnitine CoA-transferase CaiB-like acyl-CoA transferase